MSPIIPSGSEIFYRSKETLLRFPLALIASLLVALISIYLVEVEPKKMEGVYLVLAKVALVASLDVFVFAAIRLLGEQFARGWHLVWTLLAIAGIVLYYVTLPDTSQDFSAHMIPFRHFFLSLLCLIAFFWTPFVRSRLENADYWEYAKHILFSLVMAFLFTIVMVLGVNGALFAIEKLFDIVIVGKRYFQVDILIIGIFSVGYFLSQIPSHPERARFTTTPPKVEKFFTKWLLTPLSVLYFVILYAYTLKLLVVQDWPKGILAWLIVAFSVVAILTYLFWTHFAKGTNRGWRRGIWLAVLLQTVMLFIAIGMRIAAYSWTESRYMVFVLGVWLAMVSLYFLLFSKARIKWIFISLSMLIALTQFGPLSAYAVSRTAQEIRIKENVEAIKKYHPASKAPLKLRYEVSDGIRYLHRRYRGVSLKKVFPKITKSYLLLKVKREAEKRSKKDNTKAGTIRTKPHYLPEYIAEALGFRLVSRWEYQKGQNGKDLSIAFSTTEVLEGNIKMMLDVRDYAYIVRMHTYGYEIVGRKGKSHDLHWYYEKPKISLTYTRASKLIIAGEQEKIVFDLKARLARLVAKYGEASVKVDREEMVLQKDIGNLRVKLVLTKLGRRMIHDQQSIYFSGVLLVGGQP